MEKRLFFYRRLIKVACVYGVRRLRMTCLDKSFHSHRALARWRTGGISRKPFQRFSPVSLRKTVKTVSQQRQCSFTGLKPGVNETISEARCELNQMRVALFVVVLWLYSPTLTAQSLPEWDRVYTFDDSIIEMNTSIVTSISKDVSRIRFRWTFDQPQLDRVSKKQYQSKLEVMEFNCLEDQYRPYHYTFYDAAGDIVRIDDAAGKWRPVTPGSMIEKLFVSGCDLVKGKTTVKPRLDEEAQLEKVTLFAHEFAQLLEETKDFKPLVDRFFVANYLDGYLSDQQTNWFLNLNRDTAAALSREELQRFYVALMNAGYLSSLYLISQLPSDSDEPVSEEKLLPADVLELIRNHRYRIREGNFDLLDEEIDSVEQLRSYTDLLEKLGPLMRNHVKRVGATQSKEWHAMLKAWDLYQPKARVCTGNCFGLPNGTKLFEVNVPVFRLQVAEVSGSLKVVTAISRF
jgi:hypothetical protein